MGLSAISPTCCRNSLAAASCIDVLTDQKTAAHDLLGGYIPTGQYGRDGRRDSATRVRSGTNRRWSFDAGQHIAAMLDYPEKRGSAVFDYGNNLRGQVADRRGMKEAFRIFRHSSGVHPSALLERLGPFRWAALSGDPTDIAATDDGRAGDRFRRTNALTAGSHCARERLEFQGLPARICWLEYGGNAPRWAERFNHLVKSGEGKSTNRDWPGSSRLLARSLRPNRETEGMKDGSDAIADWPLLNAMSNTACGCELGLDRSRRWRRHRLLDPCRHGHSWPTARRSVRTAFAASADGRSGASASCGTPTPGTRWRARPRASAVSTCRCSRDPHAARPRPRARAGRDRARGRPWSWWTARSRPWGARRVRASGATSCAFPAGCSSRGS